MQLAAFLPAAPLPTSLVPPPSSAASAFGGATPDGADLSDLPDLAGGFAGLLDAQQQPAPDDASESSAPPRDSTAATGSDAAPDAAAVVVTTPWALPTPPPAPLAGEPPPNLSPDFGDGEGEPAAPPTAVVCAVGGEVGFPTAETPAPVPVPIPVALPNAAGPGRGHPTESPISQGPGTAVLGQPAPQPAPAPVPPSRLGSGLHPAHVAPVPVSATTTTVDPLGVVSPAPANQQNGPTRATTMQGAAPVLAVPLVQAIEPPAIPLAEATGAIGVALPESSVAPAPLPPTALPVPAPVPGVASAPAATPQFAPTTATSSNLAQPALPGLDAPAEVNGSAATDRLAAPSLPFFSWTAAAAAAAQTASPVDVPSANSGDATPLGSGGVVALSPAPEGLGEPQVTLTTEPAHPSALETTDPRQLGRGRHGHPPTPRGRAVGQDLPEPVAPAPVPESGATEENADASDAAVPVAVNPVRPDRGEPVEAPGWQVSTSRLARRTSPGAEISSARAAGRPLTAWPDENETVPVTATPGAPENAPVPVDRTRTAQAAAVLGAMPTLVQLAVDAAANRPKLPAQVAATPGGSATTAATTAQAATTTSGDGLEFPVETITIDLAAARAALGSTDRTAGTAEASGTAKAAAGASETKVELPVGASGNESNAGRENPAAGRGKKSAGRATEVEPGEQKKFLSVDGQKEEESKASIGTRVAETRPTMPAKALLSPATEVVREGAPVLSVPAPRMAVDRASPATASTADAVSARGAYAVAVVKEVQAAVEKLVPPRTTVELRLQAFDQENVRVQLVWRDGVIHARFVTESHDLQQALNREWDGVMPRLAEKGLKFAEASFEHRDSSGQGNGTAFSQEQHGRGRRAFGDRDFPEFALPSFFSSVTGRAASVPVDLPSMATAMQPLLSAPRGLRAWA